MDRRGHRAHRGAPGRARRRALGGVAAVSAVAASCVFAAPAFGASSRLSASSGSLDAQTVAAKVDPAIVDINTTLSNGHAAGTGMLITSSGEVLTNNHVIADATGIRVQIAGTGPARSAKVLGYDVADDLALIKIDGVSHLPTVDVGDPSKLSVGDAVFALGNALGKGGTPATAAGSVTALDQSITATDESGGNAETLSGLIQVDANIQPGDSGGPLVDAAGRVVGVDTAAPSGSSPGSAVDESGPGSGYAIPLNAAMNVVHQIEAGDAGTNVHLGDRAILGVQVRPRSAQSSFGGGFGANGSGSSGGGSSPSGAQVLGARAGTPAAQAGLGAGDTIVSVDATSVGSATDLTAALARHKVGDQVKIGWVDANGGRHEATVTLVAGPPA
jgi:S1-C subfamily serine protease